MAGYNLKDEIRDSRIRTREEKKPCGDCGKPIKGGGTLCKECREDFTDIIGGVN